MRVAWRTKIRAPWRRPNGDWAATLGCIVKGVSAVPPTVGDDGLLECRPPFAGRPASYRRLQAGSWLELDRGAAAFASNNGGMSGSPDVWVRAVTVSDRRWVRTTLVRNWTSTTVARRGELIDATRLRGFVALVGRSRAGLALVDVRGGDYEVVTISTSRPRRGIGQALMQQCADDARTLGCSRVWLVTTNNNVGAIAFYERFGMRLCAVHRGAVSQARALKSSIPLLDGHGVPIADELEFELAPRR